MASSLFLRPAMMHPVLVFAYCAAVLGGLESLAGAILGGLSVGILENLASSLPAVGSEMKTVVMLGLLVIVLLIRPQMPEQPLVTLTAPFILIRTALLFAFGPLTASLRRATSESTVSAVGACATPIALSALANP